MIALSWLAVALAEPLGPGSTEFHRLLGEEAPPREEPAPPSMSPWPLALGAAGLLALWWGRGRLGLPVANAPELRVVGRTMLGGRAGLAVIEVRDRHGGWRRLVVGTGDGAPRLVADLGSNAFDEVLDAVARPVDEPVAVRAPEPVAVRAPEPVAARAPEPVAADAPVAASAPAAPPATGADLVQEVLGERLRRGRSTVSTIA